MNKEVPWKLEPGTALSRRDLLRMGAGVAGLGLAAGPLRAWGAEGDPVIDFVSKSCGEPGARPRILVGYASMCGSTGEVAAAIGDRLCAAGAAVDVRHLPDVTDLAGYDKFVIGSPIQVGMWIKEGVTFLKAHQKELAKSTVAYFITCMSLAEDTAASRRMAHDYVRRPLAITPRIRPVAMGTFAGKIDYATMPDRYEPVLRRIAPDDYDGRDWDKIAKWGDELAGLLIER